VTGATPQPGDGVVYRPFPGAQPEDGVVVRVGESGLVFVRYRDSETPKATRLEDLERLGGRQ
jgi:hypothetical protein